MFVKKKLQVSQPSHQLMARHIIHKSGKTTLKQKKDAKKNETAKSSSKKEEGTQSQEAMKNPFVTGAGGGGLGGIKYATHVDAFPVFFCCFFQYLFILCARLCVHCWTGGQEGRPSG